jgi:hypothetical protein
MEFIPNVPPLAAPYDFDQYFGLNTSPDTFGDDVSDDCVIAARAHHTIRLVWARTRSQVNISQQNALDEYGNELRMTGSSDGLDLGGSLEEWKQQGWAYGGDPVNPGVSHTISDYCGPCNIQDGVLPTDNAVCAITSEQLQAGVCSYVGAQVNLILPSNVKWANKNSFGPGNSWTDTSDSSGDLHVMLLTGYSSGSGNDYFSGITWGQKQTMTWEFLKTHCWGVFFIQPGATT